MKRLDELGVSPAPWQAFCSRVETLAWVDSFATTDGVADMCATERERCNADARLIAAAPDMYEALRLVLETIDALGFKPVVESDPLALAVKCGEKALEKAGGEE